MSRLVSKKWHRNAPSHLALHFNESFFRKKNPSNYSHEEFWNSIRSSLEASKSKLINAEKRVLRVQFNDSWDIHNIIKLLDENDFHEVYLRMDVQHISYDLPYIFQSKCLTVLHLTDCRLDKSLLSRHEGIIVPSLQELKLEHVILCEDILFKFISKFPNITELCLLNCWRIGVIVLTKLDCLKKLYVKLNPFHSFANIQVVAPSLQVFHLVLRSHDCKNVPVNMDIRACKMLREFHLDFWRFPDGLDPENICSDFPHLETLLLGPCQIEKPIKISSSSLRKWVLSFPQRKTSSDGHPTEKPFGRTPTPPLRQIKHLMVDMNKLKYQHEYLMGCIIDNLLSMSHPNTLTLTIPTTFAPSAIEISKKMYGRGDRNCCLGTHGKCWRHFLKHFEVKEEKKGQSDALSSSYSHPGKVEEDDDEKYESTKLIFVFTWKFNS